MKQSILAVIVLYKTRLENCLSLNSILRAAKQLDPNSLSLSILVYDNSPNVNSDFNPDGQLPKGFSYIHDTVNSGLATAYNRALQLAIDRGYDWLLTLDQDTDIPADGLTLLCTAINSVQDRPEIAAIVPQIRSADRIVSPNYFRTTGWPGWFAPGFTGIAKQSTFAFNSGSLMRVSVLRQVGGYSRWFWLDNSDSYIFRQFAKTGKRIWVAGNLELQHDFSMLDMQQKVSPERYQRLLQSESAFWDLEMNWQQGLERTLRLAGRLVKHLLRNDSPALRRLTLQALLRRIFLSRQRRVDLWREATVTIIDKLPLVQPSHSRPRLSVCMAAYNGGAYILAQLLSIAPQLSAQDEIVIVDDASQDDTPERINEFKNMLFEQENSPNLVVLRHEHNQGVVATFEQAVRCASGDILFLSDDDDRWHPDKVAKVLESFEDQDVQLVSTGLDLIDEKDQPIVSPEFMKHRLFSSGIFANVLHNQFQGSTLAMRSSVLQHVLPFPQNRLYLHDAWIGLRTSMSGGRIVHLEEALLFYRRHQTNFSQRLSRFKQIKLRLQLVFDLLRSWAAS